MSTQGTRERFPAFQTGTGHHPGGIPHHDHRLERLIDRLPGRWCTAARWLRQPSSRWARIPAGVLFLVGGCLAILPILGLWMIPVGLILLAEDIPPLRRLRDRTLEWVERRRPHWFGNHKQISDKEETT